MTPVDVVVIVGMVGICVVMVHGLFYARPENVRRYPDEKATLSETSDEDPRDDR